MRFEGRIISGPVVKVDGVGDRVMVRHKVQTMMTRKWYPAKKVHLTLESAREA